MEINMLKISKMIKSKEKYDKPLSEAVSSELLKI